MWFVKLKGKLGADGNAYVNAKNEQQAAEHGAQDLKLQGIIGASPNNVTVEPDQQGDAEIPDDAIDVSSKYTKDVTP